MSTQMYAAIFFHGLKKYGDHLNYQTIGFCYVLKYRETPKSTTNCSGYPSFYLSKLQSYFGIQYPMFGSSWSAQKPLRPPAQTRRAAGLWSLTASAARKKSRPTSTWGSVSGLFTGDPPPKKYKYSLQYWIEHPVGSKQRLFFDTDRTVDSVPGDRFCWINWCPTSRLIIFNSGLYSCDLVLLGEGGEGGMVARLDANDLMDAYLCRLWSSTCAGWSSFYWN